MSESNTKTSSLVLVHGYLGGSEQWINQVHNFSKHFQVLTPDLPGFGLNNKLFSPETIDGYASFVIEEMQRLGIGRYHLLGHSMGGMVVQQMIAQTPDDIDKLILYGTGANGSMPGRFETLDESRGRLAHDGVEATARRIAATWFLKHQKAQAYDACASIAVKASQQAALAGLTAMENWSGVSALATITSPTLVLWGDQDRAYPWSQTEQLWKSIKNSQLAVVPGCSHAVHLEKLNLFNEIVLDFIVHA